MLCTVVCIGLTLSTSLPGKDEIVTRVLPFEPVMIEVAAPTDQQKDPLAAAVHVKRPDGSTLTAAPGIPVGTRLDDKGVRRIIGCIVDVASPKTPIFSAPGRYEVTSALDNVLLRQVEVLPPNPQDQAVAHLVDDNSLSFVATISNAGRVAPKAKVKCEQILASAPDSGYSDYARAYLAVDKFYTKRSELLDPQKLIGRPLPDQKGLARDLVSDLQTVQAKSWPLRGMVLYHRGLGQMMADNPEAAVSELKTMLGEMSDSVWSKEAQLLLQGMSGSKR
jgi:hypothetical protein